ncbi:MAG: bifunctional phosphoribosylaminoimidazolecarboxamide formyltransferase/IMP cyclohydrolase PurH, partial [Methanobacteriota archaeon]
MTWALLSVWDKRGIADLAKALVASGYSLVSSGGTGKALADAGIAFTEVSRYTGAPEMMDGRVKTLHPRIHGGLLGRPGIDDTVMKEQSIEPIGVLVANLYPFEEMAQRGLPLGDLIEFIDVGGPAMIRAAAKNHRSVAVIVDPDDYGMAAAAVVDGGFSPEQRLELAKKAFARTAAYDAAISNYLNALGRTFPTVLTLQFQNGRDLRYGENPHQQAAIYGNRGIACARPFQGKQMSYNNYLDLNAAAGLLDEFDEDCAVVVKHNNPCGVATGANILDAYVKARDVDPISAYGSVVALNREVGIDTAQEIVRTYVEVVAAPSFTPDARTECAKKENMRALVLPEISEGDGYRSIDGGLLVQRTPPYQEHWLVVTERDPSAKELAALRLAWRVCKHTRSNAIVFADAEKILGIGAGQMSRVDSAKIAVQKARFPLKGAGVASDAFLPFPDALEEAAAAGATALVQPGGSIRDAD